MLYVCRGAVQRRAAFLLQLIFHVSLYLNELHEKNNINFNKIMKNAWIIILTISVLIPATFACSAKVFQKTGREVQAAEIIAQLNKGNHIYLEGCAVQGDLDFTKLGNRNKIAGNLTQVFVGSSVTFNRCNFQGKITAFDASAGVCVAFEHNLSFTDCNFRGEANFTEVMVGGNAFFTGSIFYEKADFQGAHFRHKKVYFNDIQFESDAFFQNAVFAGDANFMHTVFSASAMFQKANAGGLMFFGDTQFNGYADFSYARAAESIFRYAKFGERYDFGYSQLNATGLPENVSDSKSE